MMISWRLSRRFLASSLGWSLASTLLLSAAFPGLSSAAEQEPLQVKLRQTIQAETAQYGDPFEGVLTQAYHFQDQELPVGTVIKGQVQSTRRSKTLASPGYIVLNLSEITLPSGESYTLTETHPLESKKILHPKAVTRKKLAGSAIPFSVVSAADSIPLKFATNMTGWQILPISLAARMALGATLSLTKGQKEAFKGKPAPARVGYGLLRGTGVVGAYYFLSPAPEPELAEGSTIPVRLNEEALAGLFKEVSQGQAQHPNTTVNNEPEKDAPSTQQQGFPQASPTEAASESPAATQK